MKYTFYKYHGAGNDFIILDNREKRIELSALQIAHMCHRHYGIGADGLMLLQTSDSSDFHMVYYNSDGNESTMCGNGGRCITTFAHSMGLIGTATSFSAIDGKHTAYIRNDGMIALHMQDVHEIQHYDGYYILNTGSPHYVTWVDDVKGTDVFHLGRTIRNRKDFQPNGINVNFVQNDTDGIWVRTYERGVEDETLSCGTGVTACAIAATFHQKGSFNITIHTPGGDLLVTFKKDSPTSAKDVVLTGPAAFVFKGEITL